MPDNKDSSAIYLKPSFLELFKKIYEISLIEPSLMTVEQELKLNTNQK